jgi:hypothetical protein
MAIPRSSHKAGKTKPQPKSFKELISWLGQRSHLAAPKYKDSTKLMTGVRMGTLDSVGFPLLGSSPLSFFSGDG